MAIDDEFEQLMNEKRHQTDLISKDNATDDEGFFNEPQKRVRQETDSPVEDLESTSDDTPSTDTSEEKPAKKQSAQVKVEVDPVKDTKEPGTVQGETIQEQFLGLLNVDMKELDDLSEHYPKIDGASGTFGRAWLAAYLEGIKHLLKGNALSDAVKRADSLWRQKVEIDGQEIGAGKPRFGSGNNGNIISGEKALMKATSVLGLGAIVQIPLWHTGIWISIKAPSEASLLELERRIANEKIKLGRYTSGMIFSNTSVYTISYLINFILNHVYDASVKNITQEALKKTIDIRDIPILIWGMTCAIYPNGYKYARACSYNPAECQHVVTGELQLSKLCFTDNNALTQWQRRLMTRRSEKFSKEDLKRYQEEHQCGGPFKKKITDQLSVHLKPPTIAQYEQSGFAWVDNIVRLLEGSLGVSLKGKERDDYILDQGRLTALRQYAHWVDKIEIEEDLIEDHDTIEQLLGTLSSDEEISSDFIQAVGQYIDQSAVSVIAIPKYHCPACGHLQKSETSQNISDYLLPLDVARVFFTLLDQRIFKALTKRQL